MTISDLSGGGAEREFANLLGFLNPADFDVHVCLWRPVFQYQVPANLPLKILDKHRPWHVLRTIGRFARLVDALLPDLVFSMPHYVNIIAGTALMLTRHRPVWVCRFNNPAEIDLRGVKKIWAGCVIPRAERILGCSDGVCRSLVNCLGLDPAQAQTICNPVDIEEVERLAAEPLPFEKREGRFVIAHAGRLSPQKNQKLLLQAVAQMEHRDTELWMVGQGPLKKDLHREAARLGIAGRVRWLGFLKNPFPIMRAADCFALSSNWEGLPTVIIEAMACGTPVVATRCPYGPDELVEDGKTGVLVPMQDAAVLAAALDRLASDEALRANYGKSAASEARAMFGGQRPLREHEALFKSLVKRRMRGGSPSGERIFEKPQQAVEAMELEIAERPSGSDEQHFDVLEAPSGAQSLPHKLSGRRRHH